MITTALSIPNPFAWLVLHGIRRDWKLDADPSAILRQWVALHVADEGAQEGWRGLGRWLEGTAPTHAQVYAEAPRSSIVGIAYAAEVHQARDGWRVALVAAKPVQPIGPIPSGRVSLWTLPAAERRELAGALQAGRAA